MEETELNKQFVREERGTVVNADDDVEPSDTDGGSGDYGGQMDSGDYGDIGSPTGSEGLYQETKHGK
jgi:hypothetical protein